MKGFITNRIKIFLSLMAFMALGVFQFTNIVSANNTPQTLPFTQNWSNAGLITADDNWSAVPGIVGYRGDDIVTGVDTDLRTITADGATTPVDVNANRNDPDAYATGGITEFDGITNPTVAFQGSGTSDVPHLVIYLNTTGQSNIQVAYNARDIDAGSDVVQQLNTQFRVGGTGVYTNLTGGYFADVTAAGATQVTPVSLTLPAAANNQSLVEIRIMTTNATGSDEFVGIDDINITAGTGGGTPTPTPTPDAPVDFNGDGKTDYAVVRNVGGTGGAPANQIRWFYNINGSTAPTVALDWGLAGDSFVPEDYDGDGKDDIAVWRPGAPTVAAFYILNSQTNTARVEAFGQTGDDPTVVGDYNGDGRADLAVYRGGATANSQSFWFYRTTPGGPTTFVRWGLGGDFPAPGDYDGDGRNDFAIQRAPGTGQKGEFWTLLATGVVQPVRSFGQPTDLIVTGDFDGDGKTDLASLRFLTTGIDWYWRRSSDNVLIGPVNFGISPIQGGVLVDYPVPGDYDGDGRTDIAVWRSTNGQFIWRSTATGAVTFFGLGSAGDFPVAFYNVH
ncbi:MAG: VCBS repeat-containing protein [Acidobacteriota bacterium]|nr:VCBS repeat-containing protein [Acidobacteriota bacterium]